MKQQQHYVPRFLLRNFCARGSEQIYVYDKQLGAARKTNVRKVASERGFYNIHIGDRAMTLEQWLGRIETDASPIVRRVCRDESIGDLTANDRHRLAVFVAAQFLRVKSIRSQFLSISRLIEDRLRATGADPKKIRGFSPATDQDAKAASLSMLKRANEFAAYFASKTWFLSKTGRTNPLYSSDCPVTRYNHLDLAPYGDLGLASPGIEIYVPLSSRLLLNLVDENLERFITDNYTRTSRFLRENRGQLPESADPMFFEQFVYGLKTGRAIPLRPVNVIHANTLQVMYSDRFLYCCDNNFGFAEMALRENPHWKSGVLGLSLVGND